MLFDKDGDGLVQTNELGTLIRALNLNPTETEIVSMMKKIDPQNNGSFNLKALEELVRERGPDQDSLQDLIDALKVFDSDHDGKITIEEFKYAMMNMGEQMKEPEIEQIVQDSDLVADNHIILEDFARMIM